MILSYEESLARDGVSMVPVDSAARVEIGVGATLADDPARFTMPTFEGDVVDPAARCVPEADAVDTAARFVPEADAVDTAARFVPEADAVDTAARFSLDVGDVDVAQFLDDTLVSGGIGTTVYNGVFLCLTVVIKHVIWLAWSYFCGTRAQPTSGNPGTGPRPTACCAI